MPIAYTSVGCTMDGRPDTMACLLSIFRLNGRACRRCSVLHNAPRLCSKFACRTGAFLQAHITAAWRKSVVIAEDFGRHPDKVKLEAKSLRPGSLIFSCPCSLAG